MVAYYNRVLEPLGLTAQQVMALGVLWREPDLSLGEFAVRAGIGKAAAVTMIQRLESMGFVARTSHPTDARLNVLRLTDKAKSKGPEILKMGKDLEHSLENAMGADRLATLIQGLETICELDLDRFAPGNETKNNKDKG